MMTPESSIEVQTALGSDIMMAFDECVAYPAEKKYVARSLERTTRWLRRCDDHHRRLEAKAAMETGSDTMKQALFGIMQGGMFKELRELSAKQITEIDLPGYAIGGLSVGEPKDIMLDVLDDCVDLLPEDKPR